MISSKLLALIFCALIPAAFAQKPVLQGTVRDIPVHNIVPDQTIGTTATNPVVTTVKPIPSWNYSAAAYDGNTYAGSILGKSPYNHGRTTTKIPTQIIPLTITITDANGTVVYDPTASDSCAGGQSSVGVVTGSPIFTNDAWTMNGVNVGTTQYTDANLRAEFWTPVANTPYHLVFQQTVLAAQNLAFGTGGAAGPGRNYLAGQLGTCEGIGVVNLNDLDNAMQSLITGSLAGVVNVGTNPIFLTKNVVMADPGTNLFSHCCVLGFHSGLTVGSNLQIYGPTSVDMAGAFGPGFTGTMAHELSETVNDPTGNNPTPAWGNQGQQSGCQTNFETGDPLSPGGIAPTSNDFVVTQNNLTYRLQEEAFFSWFYGGTSLGAGGLYSGNGTFTGHAKPCPPGGTN